MYCNGQAPKSKITLAVGSFQACLLWKWVGSEEQLWLRTMEQCDNICFTGEYAQAHISAENVFDYHWADQTPGTCLISCPINVCKNKVYINLWYELRIWLTIQSQVPVQRTNEKLYFKHILAITVLSRWPFRLLMLHVHHWVFSTPCC